MTGNKKPSPVYYTPTHTTPFPNITWITSQGIQGPQPQDDPVSTPSTPFTPLLPPSLTSLTTLPFNSPLSPLPELDFDDDGPLPFLFPKAT